MLPCCKSYRAGFPAPPTPEAFRAERGGTTGSGGLVRMIVTNGMGQVAAQHVQVFCCVFAGGAGFALAGASASATPFPAAGHG